ncbi:MAG: GntR family transcriptional regulator [Chloroflexi bacterium]|nr:GntR family transcriptional regulator [Chloroflexota bacterium]MBV9596420.1 GntR family transcriptional regulator [Chloroflexota bacterium]
MAALAGLRVHRASSAQQVAAAIREQLLRGEVAPGTRLRDQALAAALEVSRNTVREAMQILASDGLVRLNFHHGTTVAELDLEELADAYRVRRLLELAGVRAAAGASNGWLDEVWLACSQMADAAERGDMHDVLIADLRFHEALVAPLESPRLSRFYRNVQTELRLTRAWYGERLAPSVFYRRHAEIAEALRAQDYTHAEALAATLIDEGEARLRDQLCGKDGKSGRSAQEVGSIAMSQGSAV